MDEAAARHKWRERRQQMTMEQFAVWLTCQKHLVLLLSIWGRWRCRARSHVATQAARQLEALEARCNDFMHRLSYERPQAPETSWPQLEAPTANEERLPENLQEKPRHLSETFSAEHAWLLEQQELLAQAHPELGGSSTELKLQEARRSHGIVPSAMAVPPLALQQDTTLLQQLLSLQLPVTEEDSELPGNSFVQRMEDALGHESHLPDPSPHPQERLDDCVQPEGQHDIKELEQRDTLQADQESLVRNGQMGTESPELAGDSVAAKVSRVERREARTQVEASEPCSEPGPYGRAKPGETDSSPKDWDFSVPLCEADLGPCKEVREAEPKWQDVEMPVEGWLAPQEDKLQKVLQDLADVQLELQESRSPKRLREPYSSLERAWADELGARRAPATPTDSTPLTPATPPSFSKNLAAWEGAEPEKLAADVFVRSSPDTATELARKVSADLSSPCLWGTSPTSPEPERELQPPEPQDGCGRYFSPAQEEQIFNRINRSLEIALADVPSQESGGGQPNEQSSADAALAHADARPPPGHEAEAFSEPSDAETGPAPCRRDGQRRASAALEHRADGKAPLQAKPFPRSISEGLARLRCVTSELEFQTKHAG